MQGRLEVPVPSSTRALRLRAAAMVAWSQLLCVLAMALATAAAHAQTAIKAWGSEVFDSTWNEQAFVQIAAGGDNTAALRPDGSVVVCGDNSFGQCNVPALPAGTTGVEVAAGFGHMVARCSDGSVIGWGKNGNGQCNAPVLPAGLTKRRRLSGRFEGARHSRLLPGYLQLDQRYHVARLVGPQDACNSCSKVSRATGDRCNALWRQTSRGRRPRSCWPSRW